jgi:transposase
MKSDGRKLSHKTLEELRIRTVKQVEAGAHPEILAKALGLNRSTIYKWIASYASGGEKALVAKPISGRPSALSTKHILWLAKILVDKRPDQLKLPFALWTRDQIIQAIYNKFGIRVGRSIITRTLQKLGYSFQKPTLRFKQQDPIIVRKWLTEDYNQIREEARKINADIYFGDEAGVSSNYTLGKTIGKKGHTPILKRSTRRYKLNMLSAITAQGKCRFMVTKDTVNTDVFIEFLLRLMKGAKNPIFLIVDNHPIHKTHKVQQFIEKQNGKLKLFYLPPYSPELNPDELVWNDVKNHGLSRHLVDSLDSLVNKVSSRLYSLQKQKGKIVSFFKTSTTAYAAA